MDRCVPGSHPEHPLRGRHCLPHFEGARMSEPRHEWRPDVFFELHTASSGPGPDRYGRRNHGIRGHALERDLEGFAGDRSTAKDQAPGIEKVVRSVPEDNATTRLRAEFSPHLDPERGAETNDVGQDPWRRLLGFTNGVRTNR